MRPWVSSQASHYPSSLFVLQNFNSKRAYSIFRHTYRLNSCEQMRLKTDLIGKQSPYLRKLAWQT